MKSLKIVSASILSIGFGQVAAIVLHVYLARHIPLVDYADYVKWVAVLVISQVIVTLRLELLTNQIMDRDAQLRHFKNSTLLSLLVSGVLLIGFVLVNAIDQKVSSLFVLSLVVAGQSQAVITHGQGLLLAREELSRLAVLRFLTYLAVPVVQIIIFMGFESPNAMVVGHVVASMGCAALLLRYFGLPAGPSMPVWDFLQNNLRHMSYATPGALINTLSRQLPLLLIGQVGGDQQTALFGLAVRVIGAPLGIVGIGIVDIYKVSIRRLQQSGSTAMFTFGFVFSVLASVATGLAVVAFAPMAVARFMDAAWAGLDETIILLLPLFLMRFVTSPMSYMMVVAERQNWDMIWQLVWLLTVLGVFHLTAGYDTTLTYYSTAGTVLYGLYGVLSYVCYRKLLRRSES